MKNILAILMMTTDPVFLPFTTSPGSADELTRQPLNEQPGCWALSYKVDDAWMPNSSHTAQQFFDNLISTSRSLISILPCDLSASPVSSATWPASPVSEFAHSALREVR